MQGQAPDKHTQYFRAEYMNSALIAPFYCFALMIFLTADTVLEFPDKERVNPQVMVLFVSSL